VFQRNLAQVERSFTMAMAMAMAVTSATVAVTKMSGTRLQPRSTSRSPSQRSLRCAVRSAAGYTILVPASKGTFRKHVFTIARCRTVVVFGVREQFFEQPSPNCASVSLSAVRNTWGIVENGCLASSRLHLGTRLAPV
jgi:hypothetical protein